MSSNPLWDVIQEYMDDPRHRYTPKAADLMRETGVSEAVLSKWKAAPMLPRAGLLMMFAQGTGVSYERLINAAMAGKGYLPSGARIHVRADFDAELARDESVTRAREESVARLLARRRAKAG